MHDVDQTASSSDAAIGQRLRELRETRKLAQHAFAAILGVSPRTYQNYERGERTVSKEILVALREKFGFDANLILFGPCNQDDPPPSICSANQTLGGEPEVPGTLVAKYKDVMRSGEKLDPSDDMEKQAFDSWRLRKCSQPEPPLQSPATAQDITLYLTSVEPAEFPHPVGADDDVQLTSRDEHALARNIANQHASATRRAYRSAWTQFVHWCEQRAYRPLPANPKVAACYLIDIVENSGIKVPTAKRHASAIRLAHILSGYPSPTTDALFQQALRGLTRINNTKPEVKQPILLDHFYQILDQIDTSTLLGLRDRAIIAIGFFGAFRRSEIARLAIRDITYEREGIRIDIPQSKTDRNAEGQSVTIMRRNSDCPVEALQAWLCASGIDSGFVFRPLVGNLLGRDKPMNPSSIAAVVKRHAAVLNDCSKETIGGHSLRSGFITSAVELGAPLDRIMRISRHVDVAVVLDYIRRHDDWKDHASAQMDRPASAQSQPDPFSE